MNKQIHNRGFIMKYNKLTILILIAVILTLILVLVIRENQHLSVKENYLVQLEEKETKHLEGLGESTDNYNDLYAKYNELNKKYQGLAGSKGFYDGWEDYEVTGYTQNDEGCNNITSIGLNLNKDWTRYFDFVAVDPNEIPYGSVILAKFEDGVIRSGLAVDCGYKIKGRKIDWYCETLYEAFAIGRRILEVKVIK